jgi:hypothetical protein
MSAAARGAVARAGQVDAIGRCQRRRLITSRAISIAIRNSTGIKFGIAAISYTKASLDASAPIRMTVAPPR